MNSCFIVIAALLLDARNVYFVAAVSACGKSRQTRINQIIKHEVERTHSGGAQKTEYRFISLTAKYQLDR